MIFPFEERLNTNYAPSDEELLEIFRVVLEPQARLARMNDEIAQVQATLDGLKCQRDELGQRIDQHLALTSPIRRIPQETLQEIFINCLPTNRSAIMSVHESPLLLGRVCSSWRSISLSTPRLWTTVHIPIPNTSNPFPSEVSNTSYAPASKRMAELRTAALQEWLRRSEPLPVDISLSQWEEAPLPFNINPHVSQHVVEVILSVAQRWRKITVSAPAQTMTRFLTHSPDDLRFLESLAFDFSKIRSQGPISEIPQSEQNIYRTPSVRQLSLIQPRGDFLQLPVNWAYLTDLTMEGQWGWDLGLSLHQSMDLLSRCPCLVRCRLEVSTAEKLAAVQSSSLTLSKLECLSIFANANVTHLFNCLDLPVLRDVGYDSAIGLHPTMKSPLLTLFRKSGGSIRKFTTDPQLFTREGFIECLRLIPEATALAFKKFRIPAANIINNVDKTILDKELLSSFLPSAPDVLCPKLKFLEIASCLNISDEDLLSFILEKQRNNPSHSLALKQVKIVFPRPRGMDIVPHLMRFVEQGLDLQLTYRVQPAKSSFSPLAGLPNAVWV